jgi:hypothetical protein
MLSVSARKISLGCFLALPAIVLSTLRADKNLFDLIPADGGFLTLAKSHKIFSQYCENDNSVIRKFATNSSCPRVFLFLPTAY